MNYPPSIQKLITLFSQFPTVGPRTAGRFVFYLLKKDKEEITELVKAISDLKKEIKICSFCFNLFEPSEALAKEGNIHLCPICQNPVRNKTLLCVVEKETDLLAIEKTKKYKGLYFILGGTISKMKKEDLKNLRTKELTERLSHPEKFGIPIADFQEIIIAINPTAEGETTALYLERILKSLNKKITRLGRGLPTGGELEYADEETLERALEGRK